MGGGTELIPIVFFLGLSAGVIGRLKGSSFILWFLIGVATLGLGIFAALLYRVERNEPVAACPTCRAPVAISQQVCTRCGEDIEWSFEEEDEALEAEGAPACERA
jgi:hypothetical protein